MPAATGQREQQLAAQRDHAGGVAQRQAHRRRRRRRSRPASGRSRRPGRTPIDRHSSASETITANSAGWTTSTRSRPGAPGAPRSTSISDQSTNRRSASSHASSARRKPAELSSSSTPMPSHCEPWPGNTKAVLPAGVACPRTTAAPLPVAGGQLGQPARAARRGRRPARPRGARRSPGPPATSRRRRSSGSLVLLQVSGQPDRPARAAPPAAWPTAPTAPPTVGVASRWPARPPASAPARGSRARSCR